MKRYNSHLLSLSFLLISLLSFGQQEWRTLTTENILGLRTNVVWRVKITPDQKVWVGTYLGSVGQYDRDLDKWTSFTFASHGLPGVNTWTLNTTPYGKVLAGTFGDPSGGISVNDNGTWTHYTSTSTPGTTLPTIHVSSVTETLDTVLWAGTRDSGLIYLDSGKWKSYNTVNSKLPHNWVRVIVEHPNGDLWLAAADFLVRFDRDTTWEVFSSFNSGLPGGTVEGIAIDHDGSIWAACGQGLGHYDGSTWEVYNASNSDMPNSYAKAITIDKEGNKWVGMYDGGLARFDGSNWSSWNTSNSGLPFHSVNSIAIDTLGNKWIATGNYYLDEGGGLAIFKEGGLSLPTGIQTATAKPSLKLFPQPARNRATLILPENASNATSLLVTDLLGRNVPIQYVYDAGKMELTWNENEIPAGAYILHLVTNNERSSLPIIIH